MRMSSGNSHSHCLHFCILDLHHRICVLLELLNIEVRCLVNNTRRSVKGDLLRPSVTQTACHRAVEARKNSQQQIDDTWSRPEAFAVSSGQLFAVCLGTTICCVAVSLQPLHKLMPHLCLKPP